MCRRRNHRPLVVTAGVFAYNEYQKHQQKKRDHAITVDRITAEASMPIPMSRNRNELQAVTSANSSIRELSNDSPPAYDTIDSLVTDQNAYETKEKAYYTGIHTIHSSSSSSSASPREFPAQKSVKPIAASYRVYIKTRGGTLHKARLTAHHSCCTAYSIRCKDKPSSVTVSRNCTTVGTAQLLYPNSANLALDTLGLTSMSQHPRTAAWDVALPTGDGGMRLFSWKSAIRGTVVGSCIWRLEDEDGGVVAVFMDGVERRCGGRTREGVLNVVQSGLSQKLQDAVVTSCFAMVKQSELKGVVE